MRPAVVLETLRKVPTTSERRRAALVLSLMILTALLEAAGVASIMPFLAVLGDPSLAESNPLLRTVHEFTAPASHADFLFLLGLACLGVILTSAAVKTVTLYAARRFANDLRSSVSSRLLQGYLAQPYEFFLRRDSAELSKRVMGDTYFFIQNMVMPLMDIVSYALVLLALAILLIAVDPVLAAAVIAVVAGAYAAIYLAARGLLQRVGHGRDASESERFATAGEAFGGIKEIKAAGREEHYGQRFARASRAYARHLAARDVLAHVPRHAVEAVGFAGLIGMSLFLIGQGGDLGAILPLIGLYGLAAHRMLPAAQTVYSGFSQLRFAAATLDGMAADLALPASAADHATLGATTVPLAVRDAIRVDHVSYRYPGAAGWALEDVEFTIPANSVVGIKGRTGAGKTTLVDILLGLLRPTMGTVTVDSVPLCKIAPARWRASIGYVPQFNYLANLTVAENIALGIPRAGIDMDAVERAARLAQIHDFVAHETAQGYDTVVGERGVRLSGGQRQRIAIARALYHDPSFLVLDEATSALDDGTEAAVMEAVAGLRGSRTIVIIAHRLGTLEGCDLVVELAHGRLGGPVGRERPGRARPEAVPSVLGG